MGRALTVRAIETIKPGASRQEFPDGLVSGLYLVVQPSGARSWAVRYRAAGAPRKHTFGSYPGIGLKDARELASRALVSVASGGDPAAEKKTAKAGAKKPPDLDAIEKVVDSFLERYARPNMRASSAHEAERVLKKEIVGAWKGRRLSTITRADVHELLDTVVDRAPIMANRLFAVFRKMCGWAVERGIINTSPCERIKAPAPTQSRDRVLSDSEVRQVWTAAGEMGWPFGPLIRLLLLTGQRRDEVGALRWSEVDLKAKVWVLPAARAKNGVEHAIPLSAQVLDILNGLPQVGDLVFTTNGKTPVSGFSKAKLRIDRALLRKEGVQEVSMPAWTFHDLRRTTATNMARLGIALPVIEKVLNHVSGSFRGVVGIYNRHSFEDEKRHALQAWGSYVERLMAGDTNVVALKSVG